MRLADALRLLLGCLMLLPAHPAWSQRSPYQGAFDTIRIYQQQNVQIPLHVNTISSYVTPTVQRVDSYYRGPTYSRPTSTDLSPQNGTSITGVPAPRYDPDLDPYIVADRILGATGNLPVSRPAQPVGLLDPVLEAWQYFLGNGRAKNAQRAVALATPAAQAGDEHAALLLGVAHLNGSGIRQDDRKAFEWLSRAAIRENRVAQLLLGDLYRYGISVAADPAQAIAYYQQAADGGSPYAQLRLAQALLEAPGERQFAKALVYATRAEAALPQAGLEVALILLVDRPGVPADAQRAATSLAHAAAAGNAIAQYLYSICLQAGFGIAKDAAAAIPWLEKAALQGLPMARLSLGQAYLGGFGTSLDAARGLHWLELAAKDGEPDAWNYLGLAYRDGTGVPRDLTRAAEYFRRGADAGNLDAQDNLALAYLEGTGVAHDTAQGIRLLTASADRGSAGAQFFLGLLHEIGHGVPLDLERAVRRLKQASAQGVAPANGRLCELAFLAEGGLSVEAPDLTAVMDRGIQERQPACLYVAAIRYSRGLGESRDPRKGLEFLRESAELEYHYAEADLALLYSIGELLPQDAQQVRYWLERAADHGNRLALDTLKKAGIR
jgi:TPR repeat protein